ncbi:signal-regulatory protein beta-2-like [Maylandia zebra]|uniref:signal-regulatory protein beta-2-like n=1 Tax=Maylandia zebra TaxID=106582 RepID=UPI00403D41D2
MTRWVQFSLWWGRVGCPGLCSLLERVDWEEELAIQLGSVAWGLPAAAESGQSAFLHPREKGCSDHQIFDTKNVAVGQNVTLNCSRDHRWLSTNLFWIRLASQSFPEVLGSTISHDVPTIGKIHNITTKQEPGTFVLHINRAQLNDTAVYYCIKESQLTMTFLKGTFLRVKGPDPGITGVTQDSLSNPVHPGDPVTLQCSVLSNSENRTCTEDHSVYWYRAKPDESHPSLIYSHGNNGNYCERSPEAASQQKCVYSFSRNVSSSDTGTYYCAVATCGEILFGNGTKLDIEA